MVFYFTRGKKSGVRTKDLIYCQVSERLHCSFTRRYLTSAVVLKGIGKYRTKRCLNEKGVSEFGIEFRATDFRKGRCLVENRRR